MTGNRKGDVDLFTEAIQLPNEERIAFLDQACADDEENQNGKVVRDHLTYGHLALKAATVKRSSSLPRVLPPLDRRAFYKMIKTIGGAVGETRTLTPCGASPSSWCVYQFHHVRMNPKRHHRRHFGGEPPLEGGALAGASACGAGAGAGAVS